MVRINLLHDHGRNHTAAESHLIAAMLENAYRMGIEAGERKAAGLPAGWDLKTRCMNLLCLVFRMKKRSIPDRFSRD